MKRRTLMRPNSGSTDENKEEKKTKKLSTQVKVSKNEEKKKGGICRIVVRFLQVIGLIVVIPPFLNYASIQKEVRELKPENGLLYDIGWGQKLYKMCQGQGPPTVIFDAPGGLSSDAWSLIWPAVAKNARVCVYDRAGLGFSDRPIQNTSNPDGTESNSNQHNKWLPFTVERMADDMYHLMTTSSQEEKPFLLVGAELGALVAQFYTQMFDGHVMGMVLINPLSDDLFEQDGGTWLQHWYGHMIPTFQSLQLGAALGLTRLGLLIGLLNQPLFDAEVPDEVKFRQKHLLCHPKHLSSVVDEHHFMNESFSQLKTMRMIKSMPSNISVTVISGNYYDEQMPSHLNKAWAKSEQNLLTRHYPGSKHIVINSADRHMLYKSPNSIIEPINRIIRQWHNKTKLKGTKKQ